MFAICLSESYISPVAIEENVKPPIYTVVIEREPDRELWRVARDRIQNRDVSQQSENESQLRIKRISVFVWIVWHGYGSFAYSSKIVLTLASSLLIFVTSFSNCVFNFFSSLILNTEVADLLSMSLKFSVSIFSSVYAMVVI